MLLPEEVAKILHLHAKTVRELIVKKKRGAIKVGTEYRISQEYLQKFIEESQV
jgi:excisionase family DNA binding protein